jgi:site-specific DNA recombinase
VIADLSSDVNKPIRPDRVAIYIRWSTDEQTDGTTLAEQREGSEFYVKSQGWMVNPELIFIDDGYSGGSLDRPGMRQLRELVQKAEVDCVVVLKIDRLTRNIVDATQLVLVEWKDRCHLRCVRQPIDTTSETGRMIFSILATFADFERAQISERTFSGRIRRLKEGKAYGGPNVPFGLVATGEPGVRALDPERAPIIAEMFRKVREERAGVYDLLDWLTSHGIAPPVGDKWRYNSIRHMLSNPIYAGRIVYGWEGGKPPADKRHRPTRKGKPLVDVQAATVPGIVPPDVFDDVQAIIADRNSFHNKHRRAAGGAHLLSGIATCRCGGGVQVHYSRGEKYYICSNRVNYGDKGCSTPSGVMLANVVEEAVVKDLMEVYGEHHRRQQAARQVHAQKKKETSQIEREAAKRASELSKVEGRLTELRVAASMGELPLDEWRDLRGTLEQKRSQLLSSQNDLQGRLKHVVSAVNEERLLVQRMSELDRWNELNPMEQKELLREMVDRVELYKPRGWKQKYEVDIIWRFAPPDHGRPMHPPCSLAALPPSVRSP